MNIQLIYNLIVNLNEESNKIEKLEGYDTEIEKEYEIIKKDNI